MKKRILSIALVLTLAMAMVIPTAVFAASHPPETTVVSGSVATTYTIEVPGSFALPGLANGDNATTGMIVNAKTNDGGVSFVEITVADAASTGFMVSPTPLTAGFEVQGGDLGTAGWTPIGTGTQVLAAAGTLDAGLPYNFSIGDFGANQPIIDITQEEGGSYSITLTFTATFS